MFKFLVITFKYAESINKKESFSKVKRWFDDDTLYEEFFGHIQDVFEFIGQTLRADRAHHKDSDLHRKLCPQTSS